MGVAGFTTYAILFYTSLLKIVGFSFLDFVVVRVSALELATFILRRLSINSNTPCCMRVQLKLCVCERT